MNYQKLYNLLITRAKERSLNEEIEKHHIIPRCMNGTDEPENIANLTYREHFLAHWILVKMHPDNRKLMYAFNSFCRSHEKAGRRFTSHLYEYARRRLVDYMKNADKLNPQFQQKRITSTIGKVWMNNGIESIRVLPDVIEIFEDDGYQKGRLSFTRNNDVSQYKKSSETYKKKYADGYENPGKGKTPEKNYFCENCKSNYTKGNFFQWHGEKCKYTEEDLIDKAYPAKLKDKIWINDSEKNKRVSREAFSNFYEKRNWKIGFKKGTRFSLS